MSLELTAEMPAPPSAAAPQTRCDTEEYETPRVSDTYALVYAFIMLFLVPGSIAIGNLPFRTYTFQYVSLVTMPFLLGLVLTFMTDTAEPVKARAIRTAVLSPIVLMTGVAVLFTSALFLVPINTFLGPEYRAVTTPIAALLLCALASPLAISMVRRLRSGLSIRTVFHSVVLLSALVLVGIVAYLSVFQVGYLGDVARKDIVIYIIGGLVWYGPAFGLAAGVWRRVGVV